jgi:hypothetical protein
LIAQPPYPASPVAAVEDFDFRCVAQCHHPVRQIRRNDDVVAGRHPRLVLVIASEPEFQRVFDACAEWMARHRVALLEADLAKRNPLARDALPRSRSLRAWAGLILAIDSVPRGFQNPQLAASSRSPDLLRNEQKLARARMGYDGGQVALRLQSHRPFAPAQG